MMIYKFMIGYVQLVLLGLLLQHTSTAATDESTCPSNVGDQCIYIADSNYCGSYSIGATCVDGYCRCLGNVNRNPCTCLARVGCCEVEERINGTVAVGTPTYDGSFETTYSCVSGVRSQYEVHVISNYESNGHHGFGQTHTAGTTDVNVNVDGSGNIPLVLVFVSHEPVNWRLQVPSGTVIDTVLLSSVYIDDSTVTYSPDNVKHFEKLTGKELPGGYGKDGETLDLLTAVMNRFGSVYSFSGSYRADSWTLNISRENTRVNCGSSNRLRVLRSSTGRSVSDEESGNHAAISIFSTVALFIVIAVIAIVCCQYCSYKRRQSNAGRRPDNSFPEVIEIQETEMDNNLKEKNKRKKKKKIKEPIVILVPA